MVPGSDGSPWLAKRGGNDGQRNAKEAARNESKQGHHDDIDHARCDARPKAHALDDPRRTGVAAQGEMGWIRFRWQYRCEIRQMRLPRAIAYYETLQTNHPIGSANGSQPPS